MGDAPDFDAWYRDDPDPFGVRTRWYERRKESILLGSLLRERYVSAWDAACGTGDLALALAARCDGVLASDVSPAAVALTADLTSDARTSRRSGPRCPPCRPRALPSTSWCSRRSSTTCLPRRVRLPSRRSARPGRARLLPRSSPCTGVITRTMRTCPGAEVTAELDAQLCGLGWHRRVRHDDADFVLASWTRETP